MGLFSKKEVENKEPLKVVTIKTNVPEVIPQPVVETPVVDLEKSKAILEKRLKEIAENKLLGGMFKNEKELLKYINSLKS